MLYHEQFDSAEEYDAANIPDTEYEPVRSLAREEAQESFTYIDITDTETVDPAIARRHPDIHENKLEERLGRPPKKNEFDLYMTTFETTYEECMVKVGIVGSVEEARIWH